MLNLLSGCLALLVAGADACPIELPAQAHLATVTYAHAACVCLPQGWSDGADLALSENDRPIALQAHVRSRWADGSAKWLHIYAPFKYENGQPLKYVLHQKAGEATKAPVTAATANGRPHAQSARKLRQFAPVLYCVDDLGREYMPGKAQLARLDDGPVATVYHLSGEMVHKDSLVPPLFQYNTWVTLYDDRVDIEHAYTVITSMRGVRIAQLGVRLQKPVGWIGFLRDEGKRAPHALVERDSEMDIVLWPAGGVRPIKTSLANLHTFPWLHSGTYLDLHAPAALFDDVKRLAAGNSDEWKETKPEHLRTSTPDGLSIVAEFSLVRPKAGGDPKAWRAFLQARPVAKPPSPWICDSEALGRIAPRSKQHEGIETRLDQAIVNFYDADKTRSYGWASYGNAPERIVPVAGSRMGRPYVHRMNSYAHYPIHGAWINVFRGGPQSVLDAARRASSYLSAFGLCRHVALRGDGRPETKGKLLFGFYHCLNIYPWGTSDYGVPAADTECSRTGHWFDPYTLLLVWLHDRSFFAKQGYDGWMEHVDLGEDSNGREANCTLAQAVYAYRYSGDKKFLEGAKRLAASLTAAPLRSHDIGQLHYPTWPIMAAEVLQTEQSRQYVIETAKDVKDQIEGISSVAVVAEAVRLGADKQLLRKVLPLTPPQQYKDPTFQLGPGPLGERHLNIGWPEALRSLQEVQVE